MPDSPVDIFRQMAARIERNDPDDFAGAILIVPPPSEDGSSGEVVEVLLIDPNRDPVNFWTAARYYAEKGEVFVKQAQQTPMLGGYR